MSQFVLVDVPFEPEFTQPFAEALANDVVCLGAGVAGLRC